MRHTKRFVSTTIKLRFCRLTYTTEGGHRTTPTEGHAGRVTIALECGLLSGIFVGMFRCDSFVFILMLGLQIPVLGLPALTTFSFSDPLHNTPMNPFGGLMYVSYPDFVACGFRRVKQKDVLS